MSARAGLAAILIAVAPVGCSSPQPIPVPEIEAFLGVPLPRGHHDLRAADEAGIDRLMRLRLDAPEVEADAFAARLVPEGLTAGRDPGIGLFGGGLAWWPSALPEGAAGGETLVSGRRVHKVVVAPAGPGLRRVWVAAFTL